VTARRFSAQRPIRLSDTDSRGRLRLDAVARYLQDVAADDVLDAGWSPDEHIWVVRRTELIIRHPFLEDTAVELTTWCAGISAAAAARRTTLAGDSGGRIEAEMTWIHLGRDLQPERLGERFIAVYGESANGRKASTRLVLPGPTVPGGLADPGDRSRPARASEQCGVLGRSRGVVGPTGRRAGQGRPRVPEADRRRRGGVPRAGR